MVFKFIPASDKNLHEVFLDRPSIRYLKAAPMFVAEECQLNPKVKFVMTDVFLNALPIYLVPW